MKDKFVPVAILAGHESSMFEAELHALQKQSSGEREPESDLLEMYEGVGLVTIKGKLVNSDSPWNRYFGLVSYNQIRAAMVEAIELGAGAIMLSIDSPGGYVSGMRGLSQFISSTEVPVIAHTDSTMASAALFTGISADHVFADDMAEVGSVGVVMSVVSYAEMLKDQGIKVDVIRSGKHKQAGNPYEKLSSDNKKYLTDQVMTYANKFYTFVSEQRGIPLPAMEEIKTGRTFIGEESLTAGLVDKIMTFDEALYFSVQKAEKFLLDKNNTNYNYSGYNANLTGSNEQGEFMSKKTLSPEALAKLNAEKGADDGGVEDTNVDENLEVKDNDTPAEGSETEITKEAYDEMKEAFDEAQVELAESAETIQRLEARIATLEESVKTLEEDADEAEHSASGVIAIVVSQIGTMRKAMSLAAVDMEGWTPEAIETEYKSISASFEKSFPVGGVVPEGGSRGQDKAPSLTRAELNDLDSVGL